MIHEIRDLTEPLTRLEGSPLAVRIATCATNRTAR